MDKDFEKETSWLHSIGAFVIATAIFFVLIYFVAPIVEWLLTVFGRYFVPSRFGGGEAIENPGIIALIVRGILTSGISALVALASSIWLLSRANSKFLAAAFSLLVVVWGGLISFVVNHTGDAFLASVLFGTMVLPPLVVSFWVWQGEFSI